MSDLPFARVTMIHALRHDTRLVIYVEGLTSGFGGSLIVEQRPEQIFPQLFHVHARPGNPGINPDASPQDVPTVAAYSFDGTEIQDSILVKSADEQQEVKVVEVQPGITTDQDGEGDKDCDWSAIHDFIPPRPPRLRVNGICIMPTPGYKLSLRRASPQGINPHILLLELETEPPSEIVTPVLTPTPVAYEEITDFDYTQVTILPTGVTVDVEKVH